MKESQGRARNVQTGGQESPPSAYEDSPPSTPPTHAILSTNTTSTTITTTSTSGTSVTSGTSRVANTSTQIAAARKGRPPGAAYWHPVFGWFPYSLSEQYAPFLWPYGEPRRQLHLDSGWGGDRSLLLEELRRTLGNRQFVEEIFKSNIIFANFFLVFY